jgi:hypothetical protein
MSLFWKIAIPITLLPIGGLLVLLLLAPQVQRSTFLVLEPAVLDQDLLAEDLRGREGVFGMRLKDGGKLVIDHCPDLARNSLVEALTARGGVVQFRDSKRILPLHHLSFPGQPGGNLTTGQSCRQQPQGCATGAAWKVLLGRWRGAD